MNKKSIPNVLLKITEILLVVGVYIVTARIGQFYAIDPGNITPVWIPSGLMLSWVIIRGYYIWPGVFFGAFFGNIWAYATTEPMNTLLAAIEAATANGIGDCICTIGTVWLLKKLNHTANPFPSFKNFLSFILIGVILGPFVSALFGITSLWAVNLLNVSSYFGSFMTWWIGDSAGVLLITPFILSFYYKNEEMCNPKKIEIGSFLTCMFLISLFIWQSKNNTFFINHAGYILVPILFWAILRLGLRFAFGTALIVVATSIAAASQGGGILQKDTTIESVMSLQILILIVVSSIFIVAFTFREQVRTLTKLKEDFNHDSLTQLYTRNFFNIQILKEIEATRRKRNHFCIVMYDIDHFKKINDTYGHLVGDNVLSETSKLIKDQIRTNDTLARWGGEEFIILMPDTTLNEADVFAERIRQIVEQNIINEEIQITISAGVIEYNLHEVLSKELGRVDNALYKAKDMGRNRIYSDRTIPIDVQVASTNNNLNRINI